MYTRNLSTVIASTYGKEIKSQYADSLKATAHCLHEVNEKFVGHFTPQSVGSSAEFVALTGRPLRVYSEEAVETQHRCNECHFSCILVNPLNHGHFKEQLLKSIIAYNSLNL